MLTFFRKWLIAFLSFLCLGLSACFAPDAGTADGKTPEPGSDHPNILVILADDAGWGDFGFMGAADLETPNLDQLAAGGTVFTQAYVSASVCSPSRAGLLTGSYQQRFGHECNLEPDQALAFDSSQVSIAEALRAQDYHTAIFGKWHLGEMAHQHPLRNGFDHFYGFLAGGRSYFPSEKQDRVGDPHALLDGHTPQTFSGYLTDELGNQAVKYVRARTQEQSPFFAYLAFNAPHTPMEATEKDLARYPNHDRPIYAAMVYAMDRAIGQVITTLKETGAYDNTLIFFLSDNGGAHNNNSSVGPLKGWKGNQFEGGIRVPFLISWPGHVPAGAKHTGMISSLDIFATALDAAGGEQTPNLDGVSLLPLLRGADRTVDAHQTLFWRKDEMATVRHGTHKLIHLDDFGEVVYGTSSGMMEEDRDLFAAGDGPLHDSLQRMLRNWEADLKEPIWTEGERWNEVTRHIYERLMTNEPVLAKNPGQLNRIKE
ncbi:sulfatase-like hydrolase/transferase [Neolewinella persica]|uniref:sulfatase-like hydrolase/transferase n=1 Tax=Neolewinella persica TaxID=70998 RepID=UPI00036AF554|nr:sulfatase-like hydrolase/transferase [Neolewinella persica]